jgi:uncharacterized membrane protein
MSNFFTDQESDTIVKVISDIESSTVGELRLHIEDLCPDSPIDRAVEIFNKLEMYRTEHKTGILIYIATEDHKLAIIGDQGMHSIVGNDYWEYIMNDMKSKFATDSIYSGVLNGVKAVGEKLKEHFPEKRIPDNELSNEISYGKI